MLIQFNFKNVKSFRDEATLDLTATELTDFPKHLVKVGNENVLPVAAIYGANAGGKSNIYNAFEFMSYYVVNSFRFGDDEEKFRQRRISPFLFDAAAANAESRFEVYFTVPSDKINKYYNYGFCVNQGGITEEWLNTKTETAKKYRRIFYRSIKDSEPHLSGLPKGVRKSIGLTLEKEVLIISLGAKLKIKLCKKVRDWFYANQFTNFGDPLTNYVLSSRVRSNFISDKSVQDNVVNYLDSFDDHIKGFNIEKISKESDKEEDQYKISTLHKMSEPDTMAKIPLSDESAGTQKMFSLYPYLQYVLQNGSVFFVDELNARLHPLLVRYILQMFLNPEINKNHAQLVFTVHDTWLLSIPLLRRDEIWFVEKDAQGVSSLYSLVDFIEENKRGAFLANDQVKYLVGEFGAIPELKDMDMNIFGNGEKKHGEK